MTSTQQITKAMKVVSAAKLRKAQDAIIQMRPYANRLQKILSNVAAAVEGDVKVDLAEERPVKKAVVVLITSDRGLAGSYNANLNKLAGQAINETYAAQRAEGNVELMTIGKKGYDYYRKRYDRIDGTHVGLFHSLTFEEVGDVAQRLMDRFTKGEIDRVDVVYSEFQNAATQEFITEQYLPIPKAEEKEDHGSSDYIFEPSKELMIQELIPKILRTQFFKYMLDANASEHGARMTAMDKATENANDLLRDLRISYNRARQAAITTELSEIVGGAAALEG